ERAGEGVVGARRATAFGLVAAGKLEGAAAQGRRHVVGHGIGGEAGAAFTLGAGLHVLGRVGALLNDHSDNVTHIAGTAVFEQRVVAVGRGLENGPIGLGRGR